MTGCINQMILDKYLSDDQMNCVITPPVRFLFDGAINIPSRRERVDRNNTILSNQIWKTRFVFLKFIVTIRRRWREGKANFQGAIA